MFVADLKWHMKKKVVLLYIKYYILDKLKKKTLFRYVILFSL